MAQQYKSLSTKLIHSGEPHPKIHGAVSMPIFQSSTFEYAGEKTYDDVRYIRLNNTPNHLVLHKKLAALENAESALVTASGMAAISTALLSVLQCGDHLLVQNCLYGGTHTFITRDFSSYGISFDFINEGDGNEWKKKLRSNTKAIYVEAISNPLMQVFNLQDVVRFAQEHQLVSLIDNTFATPVNFRPAELGFDLSLHSCTKYMNGHTDIVAGAVIGKKELIQTITHRLNHLGGSLDPHAAFLLHRGLKTLALRVRFQNESALRVAQFLEQHPKISNVNYPGLVSNAQHLRAKDLFDGFGGMLSFELRGNVSDAEHFIKNVTLPIVAPSLGGVETLITRPVTTSHAGMSKEERDKLGITDTLIRISIGIEATEDLLEDFENALKFV